MTKRIILFANHNNGYNITNYLLKRKNARIIKLIVLDDTRNQWWRSVKKLAMAHKIEHIVFKDNASLYSQIKDLHADLIISANWRYKLTPEILKIPTMGAVNFHNSLLPRNRGAYANSWALYNGDKITGVTLHWMTEHFDDGRIIAQKKVPINSWDTARDLWDHLNDAFLKLFKEIWPHVDQWRIRSKHQKGASTYHSVKDYKNNNEIKLNSTDSAKNFINKLRAKTFYPYHTDAFFIDPKTKKKIFISVQLTPSGDHA